MSVQRFRFEKVRHGFDGAEWQLFDAYGEQVGSAWYPILWSLSGDSMQLTCRNLHFALVPDKPFSGGAKALAPYQVRCNGNVWGQVVQRRGRRLPNYEVRRCDGAVWGGYIVGFGSDGMYLCGYRSPGDTERIVGQIELPMRIENALHKYTFAAQNDENFAPIVLMCLYHAYIEEEHRQQIILKSVDVERVSTIDKWRKAKYRPEFC